MQIVMFSINPLYPDLVTGGASKHLFHIANHLGARGHNVEILCAQTKGKLAPFSWGKNISVFPILPFKLPFPQPYAISGADLAMLITHLVKALQKADRFYIHDGEWLVPDIYESIPTITSFRDNIYPESVLGTFIHKADDVICVSKYSASVIEHTTGQFYPALRERLHQVNNGIDLEVFYDKKTASLADTLRVRPDEDIVLLHPHRPEPGKGLPETIRVVDALVHEYDLTNLKVLIPEWIGEMVSSQDSKFYSAMMTLMSDLGVREYFRFIPWLPMERMPELYSLGDVTLCLGSIVEAFGNVAYESLACGTPCVVARVGAHRTLMPDKLINKVHFGDIASAVEKVKAVLSGDRPPQTEVIAYLRSELDFQRQVNAYADIIENCKKRDRLQFSPERHTPASQFIIAPWCYMDGKRIYHDFHGAFESADLLASVSRNRDTITRIDAEKAGVENEIWDSWIEKTWIVSI
ncbi:MAG: glycosyltransferase family 4 protein [Chloroflexota bacterium]|nr:glycosyltransferase family 4 protein [Chloroflexota bacterium]